MDSRQASTVEVHLANTSTVTTHINMLFSVLFIGLWSKWLQVKTATGQNCDTEMATDMAIVKMATNPNNTYSSSDTYRP